MTGPGKRLVSFGDGLCRHRGKSHLRSEKSEARDGLVRCDPDVAGTYFLAAEIREVLSQESAQASFRRNNLLFGDRKAAVFAENFDRGRCICVIRINHRYSRVVVLVRGHLAEDQRIRVTRDQRKS